MRNNFWKWLKRFFVVLPILMMLLQFVFSMGYYWRSYYSNTSYDPPIFHIGQTEFIETFVVNGFESEYFNPLIYNYENIPNQSILYNINNAFKSLYGFLTDDIDFSNLYINNPYAFIILNFLTWWVFVELVFLFFRFVTFLISWVNSLFDNTFKKIRK